MKGWTSGTHGSFPPFSGPQQQVKVPSYRAATGRWRVQANPRKPIRQLSHDLHWFYKLFGGKAQVGAKVLLSRDAVTGCPPFMVLSLRDAGCKGLSE